MKKTKLVVAKEKQEKYYKQFDFFFNRTCFRTMTEFYKEKFSQFYNAQMLILKKEDPEVWKVKQKQGGITATTKLEMDLLLEKFIVHTFGTDILAVKSELEKKQLVNHVMLVVFSHRYCKGDVFINEALAVGDIDFTIVRDVMYKYSKKAQDRFFQFPI